MKKGLIFIVLIIVLTSGCKKAVKRDNPFLNTFNTTFKGSPFEKIKAAHYMSGYLKGFEEQKTEIKAIIYNPGEPTFEKTIMEKYSLIPMIKPRYRPAYFNHIWAGGYSAGYYSYIWCKILDASAFQAFNETGNIFNKEVAVRFEKEIPSKGATRDPYDMYISYSVKEPSIDALHVNRGLRRFRYEI